MAEMRRYIVDGGALGYYGLEKEMDGVKRGTQAGKLLQKLTFIFPIATVCLSLSLVLINV